MLSGVPETFSRSCTSVPADLIPVAIETCTLKVRKFGYNVNVCGNVE